MRRRRLTALATGTVLAAALAAILFATTNTTNGAQTGQAGQEVTNTAPGIDQTAAGLMQLNVVSPQAAQPAPPLNLTDQFGRPTTLAQFKGKVVIWSLNDDRCTDLCTLFAETVVAADRDLGPAAAANVVFLSVNANPFYPNPSYVKDWSARNQVGSLPNWVYVTGTPAQLQKTWADYHVTVLPDQKTRTVTHDALVEFIDPQGLARAYGYFDQGAISTAFYAHAMAQMADDLLPGAEQVRIGGPDIQAPATRPATIGQTAPAFPQRDQLDTRPLVLNFWSSTCSACTAEMPALEQVQKDFGTKINIAGVDVADPSRAAKPAVTYRVISDPDGTIAADYRVDALPVTFIIGPGGQILARHEGALTTPQLEAVLQMDFQDLVSG